MAGIPRPTQSQPVPLHTLVEEFDLDHRHGSLDAAVSGVSLSSGDIQEGDLFVAVAGRASHGASFVGDAVNAGAAAVLTDHEGAAEIDTDVPVMVHPAPRACLGRIAKKIYDPGVPLPAVFAVTGTNGKTSVALYLEAIARQMGLSTALSTTHERRILDDAFRTPLTTPEAPELHAMLAVAAERGVQVMALEASAQAVQRHRLDGLTAAVAGFTNLSHDHFEDFGDLETYLGVKAQLFTPTHASRAVISLESVWGKELAAKLQIPFTTIGDDASGAEWHLDFSDSLEHEAFRLSGPEGDISSFTRSLGWHMARNAALAALMLSEGGFGVEAVARAIDSSSGGIDVVIPGRLERVSGRHDIAVYVDAGRSEDAYRHTFQTLRRHHSGRLIVVCGTSGDRDRSKRPLMGRVAAESADVVIVTDDDPRREDPAQIRADLLQGAREVPQAHIEEIADPTQAISRAVSLATAGDAVVWMGPGSQTYRDVGGVKQEFSATNEARSALAARQGEA